MTCAPEVNRAHGIREQIEPAETSHAVPVSGTPRCLTLSPPTRTEATMLVAPG